MTEVRALSNILSDEYVKAGYTAVGETTGQQSSTHYAIAIKAMSIALAEQAEEHAQMVENLEGNKWLADLIRGEST